MTSTLFQTLRAHFESRELSFNPHESAEALEFGTNIRGLHIRLLLAVEDGEVILCAGLLPLVANEAKLEEVGELLHRINYRLRFGAFQLDHADGELRFFLSTWVGTGPFDPVSGERILALVAGTITDWLPAIAAVLLDDAIPSEAFNAQLDALRDQADRTPDEPG